MKFPILKMRPCAGADAVVRPQTGSAKAKAGFPRHVAMLAASLASLAAAERAQAACTPAGPVSDTTITCSDATSNQNDPTGYASGGARNTINIQAGASVIGTDVGVAVADRPGFNDHDTINNSGTIVGASGVRGFSGVVNNNAVIWGINGNGVSLTAQGVVNNAGRISGTNRGVEVENGTVTNAIGGQISGGNIGVDIENRGLETGITITVTVHKILTGVECTVTVILIVSHDRLASPCRGRGSRSRPQAAKRWRVSAPALTDCCWSGLFAPCGLARHQSKIERMALGSLICREFCRNCRLVFCRGA